MKFYTPDEVQFHNSEDDCWISIFDNVFDLTQLIEENRGVLVSPLIEFAGTSLSHWFDEKTNDIKYHIDPIRNIEMPYTPFGRFVHVPPAEPTVIMKVVKTPWWKDEKYMIGKVT